MPQSVKISVIMPVYNVEKYLARCLSSLFQQTYQNFEIICIDDGSTDNSLTILQEFQKNDSRLKILTQKNQGASCARNKGLQEAEGDYIYFMDSDDALHPQTFETCLHFALKYQAKLVCFQFHASDGLDMQTSPVDITQTKFSITNDPLFWCLKSGHYKISFNVWTKFFAADLIKNMRFVEHIIFEDAPYTVQVLLKHPKTVLIDADLYAYTKNLSSVSHRKVNLKSLNDYRLGMQQMYMAVLKDGSAKDLKYLKKVIFPRYLNNQYKCCKLASKEQKREMYAYFAQSLKEYHKEGLISLTGCGLLKSLKYLFLILKY